MKLEINHKEKPGKTHKHKEATQYAIKNQLSLKKSMRTNENVNPTIQNLWDAAKAVLRGKFIMIQAYLRKLEKSQMNNQTLHVK